MSAEKQTTQNNTIKPIQLTEHGNFLYGTLDGIDFTPSGIMQETKRPYGASIRLKFIMKSTFFKELNGVKIPIQRAISQIVKLPTTDDKLASLVQKYNELVGKDLFINYNSKDGDILNIQDENEIVEIK
ncbi:hypothetical protein L5F46_00560 [Aliarcobacter butzleri]|uniref:hypothetical protein n=1 Tax=Aliarcobacter butzleri TaxID=28197 RepID=UPI00189F8B2E|nr:hypothetical protein [Aliarcobacter butzleri]MBF7064624.1 hypothetical protein [Aliarcobacter butzleri]MCG3673262.1 hypothetical protein [Aliarcobacter butzleri]